MEVGGHAEFSCSATGLPTPNVKWLVKGVQQSFDISTSSVVFRNTTIKATSTFSMFNVPESMSGQVTCLAVHANGGELYSVASTANLVVLSESTCVYSCILETLGKYNSDHFSLGGTKCVELQRWLCPCFYSLHYASSCHSQIWTSLLLL